MIFTRAAGDKKAQHSPQQIGHDGFLSDTQHFASGREPNVHVLNEEFTDPTKLN